MSCSMKTVQRSEACGASRPRTFPPISDDRKAQPVGLLLDEGTGPGGADEIHVAVHHHAVAAPYVLGILAANFEDGFDRAGSKRRAPVKCAVISFTITSAPVRAPTSLRPEPVVPTERTRAFFPSRRRFVSVKRRPVASMGFPEVRV